ncbi:hypothetical protein F4780DRAFT_768448 [Xylariomycetidae sp. FL0641]|nr:hypothetical protein F4780DRAFT_768448 [Xylariomycetidae sp. FL0641]
MDITTTSTQTPAQNRTMENRRKKLRRRLVAPEIGSLYDILHDHAGVSLYLLPICWTDFHTQLLGCRWVQLPAQRIERQPSTSPPRRPQNNPPTVVKLGRWLDVLLSTDGSQPLLQKNRCLRSILATCFSEQTLKPQNSADLDLRFGRRCYSKAVRCQSIWTQPEGAAMSFDSATTWAASQTASQMLASMTVTVPTDDPVLAFISRSHLKHVRNNCYRVLSGPNKLYNGPVHRLQMLRSKNLLPSNPDEDQYFIAIMIAMAQNSVYADIHEGTGFAPRDVKVRVITVSEDDSDFIIYTATISAAFLTMFDQPNKAPKGDTRFDVQHSRVPIWPVIGLKERLGKALGKDLVGDFDGVPIDTYEHEVQSMRNSPSPKRRREALSEVLNASFSEDRETELPGTVFGKRRCLEEGRVGVVR